LITGVTLVLTAAYLGFVFFTAFSGEETVADVQRRDSLCVSSTTTNLFGVFPDATWRRLINDPGLKRVDVEVDGTFRRAA
jgi:hypothetical protein